MKALVVFESMWGNTAQVARAVAQGLSEAYDVQVLQVGDAPSDLTGVGLLVVGGPTHAFSMSRQSTREDAVRKGAPPGHVQTGIREWLDALPEPQHLAVATFDTRVAKVKHMPGSAARKAAKEVRRHHLGRVVGVESFFVDDMEGPLLPGELDRARSWGGSLFSVSSPV